MTGRYDRYVDVEQQFLASRFVPQAPTIFEYFRRSYNVPDHQALIVNGEDRTQEEFYTFSNNHLFGVDYRSEVLSLYRYKVYRLEQQLASGTLVGDAREQAQKNLAELYTHDYRGTEGRPQATEVQAFWDRWREFYSDDPNRSARGDRLLTTLSLRALRDLHPRLLMINYNDPDYVHWGKSAHYFEGIKVIDEGLRQLVWFLEHDEFYAGNTVLFVVPDCGRDTNRFVPVPFQHHFGTKSSHEIWAFAMGPGIARNVVVDKPVDQISLAATIGQTMGFDPSYAEGPVLEEAFA